MKKTMVAVLGVAFTLSLLVAFAFASSEMDTAKAMVEKGIAFLKANGKEKALAEFSDPKGQFVKGEVYAFVWDLNAVVIAHPINQKIIGKNMLEVPDAGGKLFRKEVVELARTKGSGWVDYKYKNPQTNKIEDKTTFIKKEGDMIIAAGAYKH